MQNAHTINAIYIINTIRHTTVSPKSKASLPTKTFIIDAIITPSKAINKYVPNFDRSIFVLAPKMENTNMITDVIKNTDIIDIKSYTTKIAENVNPVKNEYSINPIFAPVGLILLTLADRTITVINSAIMINQYIPDENTVSNAFAFPATKTPVENVTNRPINIHKNTFDK